MDSPAHLNADTVSRPSSLKRFARAGSLLLLVLLVSARLGGAGVKGDTSGTVISRAYDAAACPALIAGAPGDAQLVSAIASLTPAAQGPPNCPFLIPFCPENCHLDHACPVRCHCPH